MNNEPIFQYQGNRRSLPKISSERGKILLFFVLGAFAAITFSLLFKEFYTPREISYFRSIFFSDLNALNNLSSGFRSVIFHSISTITELTFILIASVSYFSKKLFRIISLLGGAMLGRSLSCLIYFTHLYHIPSLSCVLTVFYFFSVNVTFIVFAFVCEAYSRELDYTSDRLMTEKNFKHFSDFLSASGSVILLTVIKTIILITIQ